MGQVTVKIPRLRFIKGRYFWWPTPAVKALGFHSEPLGADLGKACERARQLNAAVDVTRRGATTAAIEPESVAALIRLYESDATYKALAPATQRSYSGVFREIERKSGRVAVRSITRKELKELYREITSRGLAVAALHMRVWRLLLSFAVDEGWRPENPATRMRIATPPSRSTVWTWDQVATFCKAADKAGARSMALAVMLAYDLGQRQGDVLALTRHQLTPAGFRIQQGKTGEEVVVPLRWPETRKRLAGAPKDGVQLIVCETTGLPYRLDHFRHEFARIRALAKLPGQLQFRDLRRTAATELGDGGATDDQIRSVTGHRSRAVVAVYVRPTGTQAAAAQATRKRTKRGAK